MADATPILCSSECVITVVHEIAVLPSLTLEQGWLIAKAIFMCWCIAWGFRQLMRLSKTPERIEDDGD